MDKRILVSIMDKFGGGPVGLSTLAVAVGEESGTLEEVYEPFLIQQGFMHRTLVGREATDICYQHFGIQRGQKQMLYFNAFSISVFISALIGSIFDL